MAGILVACGIALYVVLARQAERMNMNFFTFTIGYGTIGFALYCLWGGLTH